MEHNKTAVLRKLTEDSAMEILAGVTLPPQPGTLLDINRERAKVEPDVEAVARIIERDLSVAAAVLKTINSPWFGLPKKVESVRQAVVLLGMPNVVNVVIALAMKSAIQGDNQAGIDRLFDEANDTALVLSSVMREVPIMSADKAYLLGLFRDCGMPILLQRFPQYAEVLREAAKRPEQPLTDIEDARLRTDHAVVGALMSRHWHLPEEIGTIILNHHRTRELFGGAAWKLTPSENNIRTVIAVMAMVDCICHRLRKSKDSPEWAAIGERVLAHLKLDQAEFEHLAWDQQDRFAA
jgi:HD-like signal output (HDOD) protein